jgi:hypothetical protein
MHRSLIPSITAGLILLVAPSQARQYSPRVISPHVADTYSMQTFANFALWQKLEGDARAWEVFQYLTDERTGLFPLGQPVREGRDVLEEFRQVRDPVKLINVYGYGYCGILGPTMAGVCEQIGMGPSRTLVLPGWHHVVGETYYDNRWHYLDLDVRAAFRRADGRLASMAEAQRDDALWRPTDRKLFFPLDRLEQVREVYRTTPVHPYYGHHFAGHTMDYVLRQGETFTRFWTPQQGRWHHDEEYHTDEYFRGLFERAPRGPKCKHAGWSVHTHGNGRFVYEPDWTSDSSDFEDGVYDSENVVVSDVGLRLEKPGRGFAIFEVRSPYVIVPLVGDMTTKADDREASVVKLDASGVGLSVSTDNGLTWNDLPAGHNKYDLTAQVSGGYGYLLKLSLAGDSKESRVRKLSITTWVQVAPASLPALRQGVNRMEFRTGDHYGLASRVTEICTDANERSDLLKHLHEPPTDYDPSRKTARVKGSLIAKVQSPPRSRIAWFSAGGSFHAQQGEAGQRSSNRIEYALDEPTNFTEFYNSSPPADQAHWHFNADRAVKLETPSRRLFLRYTSNTGINNLRIYAHSVDEQPKAPSPVVITHAWTENGVAKTHLATLERPGSYDVTTRTEPTNVSIELSIPSVRRLRLP